MKKRYENLRVGQNTSSKWAIAGRLAPKSPADRPAFKTLKTQPKPFVKLSSNSIQFARRQKVGEKGLCWRSAARRPIAPL